MQVKMVSVQSILVVVVCSLAIASCTPFTDCGSTGATIDSVTMPGCDQKPCLFKRGSNVSFSMAFTPNQDVREMTTKITAFLGSMSVPFKPNSTRSCDFLKSNSCPLSKGEQTTYSQELPVRPFYPVLPYLKVRWELVDDSTGSSVTCFQVDAKVE